MAEGLRTPMTAAAFDQVAAAYDADFAGTTPGLRLRESVWSRLAPFVKPGMHVLDLGCGTGEDALWLARKGCHVTAADGSPAMLERVAFKAAQFNLAPRIRTIELDLNGPAETDAPFGAPFDLVVSNFGAVNCADDVDAFGGNLAAWVKPGGVAALVVMGRFCAWETAYYLARFDRRAWRRLSGSAQATIGSRSITIRYWSRGELVRTLHSSFRPLATYGVGTFLPPSYLFHSVERRPRLFRALLRWESYASHIWPLSRMGDHMLVILRRLDPADAKGRQQ